ncbi:MAG: acetate--CoA ligase family protein [bacterium]
MEKLFYPESIAVIGVSERIDNFGKNIVKNLMDFQYEGKIYPVGQHEGNVQGLKIYQSVEEIPGKIGLAVFLIPSRFVPEHFAACAKKGVKRAVISSGGFSEFGAERAELENQLLSIAKENDIRFLGPNCIALINQDNGICLPFVRMSRFPNGNVSLLTQSGGVGLGLIYMFASQNLGINKYVSLGNKLNIGEPDMIKFLETDKSTGVIGFYLEEINRGREFMEAVRGCTKPIVIMKTNTTEIGAKTAKSHTAAIANDDKIVDAAFRQVGVSRVSELDEIAPACKIFAMPPMKGNRIAIITPTGGYAVILADLCEKNGFVLPEFPKGFTDYVQKHVRAGVINLNNPLDLGDMFDLQMVSNTIMRALQEEEFDALMLSWIYMKNAGITADSINIFPHLDKMLKLIPKPVVLSLVGNPADIAEIQKTTKYPIFTTPEESLHALKLLYDYSTKATDLRAQQPVIKEIDEKAIALILDAAAAEGRQELGMESLEILAAAGIPTAKTRLAATAAEAAEAASALGFPVAVKIASPDVLHKTEVKGIILNIYTVSECADAFTKLTEGVKKAMPESRVLGVYVQKMAVSGREIVIGAKENESFGHVVLFGLGGIFVEALEDVALRVAPIGPMDADIMITEIRAKKVLGAFRGMEPADTEALKDILFRISTLVTKFPMIKELDINPVIAYEAGKGCLAVDARIILGKNHFGTSQ